MVFKDYFSSHAGEYAKYRPVYPERLFSYLAELTERNELAWDSATGNGQAALGLVPYFRKVIATDASVFQIENAFRHPKIIYMVTPSESTRIKSGSVDLITVATAIHWLQLDKFYIEVKRVAHRNAVIAVWNYFNSSITPEIDEVIEDFSENMLCEFWPPEARKVKNFEENIYFPFKRIECPEFFMEHEWNLNDFMNYLSTWSSVQKYMKLKGLNPLKLIYDRLVRLWGNQNAVRKLSWKLEMKVGKVE
ncbi:MAG: class I SAM-dependent methyltransferase [Ignavibacteria bacterium]|nr:class I SAM-dependent methyltransferase [Ignavibacteria bacterium]